MIVGSVRSGLVEGQHPVTAVAVDAGGRVVATLGGDLDREFFYRSSIKPFQAAVSQRAGADLGPEQLAIAASSHGGQPIHLAYVKSMLADVGLDVSALRCPPDFPMSASASRWLGHAAPESLFHNCSGKHSAMLRACVASGWSLEYTTPDHPLQRQVINSVADLTGMAVEPTGIDGCGIPTLRGSVVGLARAFSRLATDDDLIEVADATFRFVGLTSDSTRAEANFARWFPGPVKGGAMGCIGMAWPAGSMGFAAKSWTGVGDAAAVGLFELLDRMGILPGYQREMLQPVARPAVLGGGQPVGQLEPVEG